MMKYEVRFLCTPEGSADAHRLTSPIVAEAGVGKNWRDIK